ncbi:MAG: YbgC/FadM family acyl-CoA thioesterase [Campylobacterales bacterium]|nr:YbgC/FadM family acyl-CoA thioesterase [Campylobacterales bacterium]
MQIRVYYEDTDAGGVVYHANYLKYCERARSEAFYEKGLSPVLAEGHFVARKLMADYIVSAKLGDMLEVQNTLVSMKGASFVVKQQIYKESIKIFELEVVLAYISFDGKPKKLDAKVKEMLVSLF